MLETFAVLLGLWTGLWSMPVPADPVPPSDQEVLQALPPAPQGIPYVYEAYRDDMTIVKNWLGAGVTGLPIAGVWMPVAVEQWDCTVYYTETLRSQYPFPLQLQKQRVERLRIDKVELGK